MKNIEKKYANMSDEEKRAAKDILDGIFTRRFEVIIKEFDVDIDKLEIGSIGLHGFWAEEAIFDTNYSLITVNEGDAIGLNVFGVKDLLHPIDEYIEEIKKKVSMKKEITPMDKKEVETQDNIVPIKR